MPKQTNKFTLPRGYLSPTQLLLWEKDKREYKRVYFEGGVREDSAYTLLGKKVHKAIELDVRPKEIMLEHIKFLVPRYKFKERELKAEYEGIKLLGVVDGMNPPPHSVIADYKTGKKYTQSMVDSNAQLSFYALLFWLINKKLPRELHIVWIPTEMNDGVLSVTGDVQIFRTVRTLTDLALIGKKIKNAAEEISLEFKREIL